MFRKFVESFGFENACKVSKMDFRLITKSYKLMKKSKNVTDFIKMFERL